MKTVGNVFLPAAGFTGEERSAEVRADTAELGTQLQRGRAGAEQRGYLTDFTAGCRGREGEDGIGRHDRGSIGEGRERFSVFPDWE